MLNAFVKHNRMKLILAVLLTMLVATSTNSHADTGPARLPLVTGEWPPYTSQELPGQGVFTEIVSVALTQAGFAPSYTFFPWKRGALEVKQGGAFAVFPYIKIAEREKDFYFSDPIMPTTGRFFYLKNRFPESIDYRDLNDLRPYRIGGVLGYWYSNTFAAADLNVEYVPSDRQSIQKLYLKRIDLAACEELVGWALIDELFPDRRADFAVLDKPLNRDSLRLMVSKTYPHAWNILQKFNQALARQRENGTIDAILRKHDMTRYAPKP